MHIFLPETRGDDDWQKMERNRDAREGQAVIDEAYGDESLHEYVKCVVIGDTAVGKTRLICSHVYGYDGMPLELLTSKPHLPTVFAIDQYMSEPTVRERARYVVDGVHVSLRIWDTFGDHEKNRKFAYQHAHVVVMCFSIGMPASLKNINAKWFLEIRKFCPRVPIILVGTQLDRRHTSSNRFRRVGHARLRSYLAGYHEVTTSQLPLVPPEIGRQTARDIGAFGYYESSIVTKHGVDDIFVNAIRAALIGRRKSRPMLSSHLKRVEHPFLQEPYLPPKPPGPTAHVPVSTYYEEQASLYGNTELADVLFLVEGANISGHAVILAASSSTFATLLLNKALLQSFNSELDHVISHPTLSSGNLILQEGFVNGVACQLPQGFVSIDTMHEHNFFNCKVIVKVIGMSAATFQNVLEYLYTGAIKDPSSLCDVLAAGTFLQIPTLKEYASNLLAGAEYMSLEPSRQMRMHFVTDLFRLFFNKQLFSDVTFVIDGTAIPAHKAVLIPHCQMMEGMFRNGNFRESGTENVSFNDTNVGSFQAMLEYIYTGSCSAIHLADALEVLKLANFLCLPRLVTICEQCIIKETDASLEYNREMVMENIFEVLKIAQLHNAPQLTSWCMYFMTVNYNDVCDRHGKELKEVNMTTLKYLEENRWPPVWYLKEHDSYIKACRELDTEKEKKMKAKRKAKCHSCF